MLRWVGVWPRSIDPFDGKALRYRFDADGYAVYSVGRNQQDDGDQDESLGGGDFVLAVRAAK